MTDGTGEGILRKEGAFAWICSLLKGLIRVFLVAFRGTMIYLLG